MREGVYKNIKYSGILECELVLPNKFQNKIYGLLKPAICIIKVVFLVNF